MFFIGQSTYWLEYEFLFCDGWREETDGDTAELLFGSSYRVLTPSFCCTAQRKPHHHQIEQTARQFKPDSN